jgi:excisionase family DNA binding protein
MLPAEQQRVNSDVGGAASIADEIERSPTALTVRDITKFLRVSDQTVYRMTLDGTIPFFRVRGAIRFDPKQISGWLRKKSVNAV